MTDVLSRLRELARREAQLLFRERSASDIPLHLLCTTIGETFDAVKGAMADAIATEAADNGGVLPAMYHDAVRLHLPAILAQPEYFARVLSRVPAAYLVRVAATALTSTLLYDEGLQVSRAMHPQALLGYALAYAAARHEAESLGRKLTTGLPLEAAEAADLAKYLSAGGARAILTHRAAQLAAMS